MPPPNSTRPEDVERMALLLAVVRQVAIDEVDAQQADRDVDEEHPAPVEIGDDQAAGDRPDHRADHARHRHEAQVRTRSALS